MALWLNIAELQGLRLAGLPSSARGISKMAKREDWASARDVYGKPASRKRPGRGGGLEYQACVLPKATCADLIKRGLLTVERPSRDHDAATWKSFERLPHNYQVIARFRLSVLKEINALRDAGSSVELATKLTVERHREIFAKGGPNQHKFSRASVFNWRKMVRGLDDENHLPALAPAWSGNDAGATKIDDIVIDVLRADYLRNEQPSFMSCYERLKDSAALKDVQLPPARVLKRRLDKVVPKPTMVFMREGPEKLEQMFPAQKRDRQEFHALEAINADGHIWDVFVHDEDSPDKPYRPVMCAIQDLHSNKILSWRIGRTLGADLVRLCFGDCFRDYGIPNLCWLDNGREFASKMVTGGSSHRFRFKIKKEEPTGFLTALGVDVRWTRPYRGQSKPIERAFRDFCDHIAKHPAFAGAYTGNMVTNKPANYGSRSVPIAQFKAVVTAGIKAHNAREGRRTAVCKGKLSFDAAFDKSYAVSAIRRATAAQLRQCMLAGEFRKSKNSSGSVTIAGNEYWAPEMAENAGERFTVRFDPDNMHANVHVYRQDGSYLCEAECWGAYGFSDQKGARDFANKRKAFLKAQKDKARAEQKYSVADVDAFLPDVSDAINEALEKNDTKSDPKVVAPVFRLSGNTAIKSKPEEEFHQADETDFANFADNITRIYGDE